MTQNESDNSLVRIGTYDEVREAISTLFIGAKRQILGFSPTLDPEIFNSHTVCEALADFASRHQRNRANFIIEDGQSMARGCARFMHVCRSFSDFIQVKQSDEEAQNLREMFLIIDDDAYLHQPETNRLECIVSRGDRTRAAQHKSRFNAIWNKCSPVALHTLGL